jgi:hypothetical protein
MRMPRDDPRRKRRSCAPGTIADCCGQAGEDRSESENAMHQNIFGNLTEWGHVLERIEELIRSGQIEEHQDALVMLLRYRDNWRVREAALESVRHLKQPTDTLVRQVCSIMTNEELYFQVRVLAAEALGSCLDRLATSSKPPTDRLRQEVREQMHGLLDTHDVPVLHQAVRRILPKIE